MARPKAAAAVPKNALPRKVPASGTKAKTQVKTDAPKKSNKPKATKSSKLKSPAKKRAVIPKKAVPTPPVKPAAEAPKRTKAKTPTKVEAKTPAKKPTNKVVESKPNSKPLFGPHSKDLYGYWFGKWYEVEVLKETDRWEKGQHVYLIRWTKDVNTAKPGEWATNESYYPEDWIFPKEDIPPHQLSAEPAKKASSPKSPASPKPAKPAKPSAAVRPSPKPVPAPAFGGAPGHGFGVFSAGPQTKVHKYAYKWQYFDTNRPSKGSAGWHDYDISGSDVVEEAYQSWVTNPYIDVRAVYSGHWNYMIDFNQMQQTNVDHEAHTMRAIRRVKVDDESDAMEEQRTIRRQVSLSRISSQMDQINASDESSSSNAKPLERAPSQRGPSQGAAGSANPPADQPAVGTLVRVPSGRQGIVLTNTGGPSLPVQVQFPNGDTQFLEANEVHK